VSADRDGDAKLGNAGKVAGATAGEVAASAEAAAETAGGTAALAALPFAGAVPPLDPVLPEAGTYCCNRE